jgi:hypothetical protein
METFLSPIEKPKGLMMKLAYFFRAGRKTPLICRL